MAFIRDRHELRTGYQNGEPLFDLIDNQCDFVMVYRLNDTTAERIRTYKEQGYVVHLMTGISWGAYLDYLQGDFDGRTHWDEAQTDRDGNQIIHGVNVPYMVPTVSFADYISQKLRVAVDAGVEAIHVEEPEFWDRAGYSEAFKREYELYYREPWTPPYESTTANYRCAKLKAYLYSRTIDRVSSSIKEYAKTRYDREIRFYVPTHSLLNYTQWKIVSPEGKLSDLAAVDGCIAQVWTGTSREKNWFNGSFRERTFETAYLEYGIMQELVKGTGRKMWFLHDPIEDNPIFDWNDYRRNYFCTVSASLLHPKVNTYEICPWPSRVFTGRYPKDADDATTIPPVYATLLNNNFQTLGTMGSCELSGLRVGVLSGDCQLYQREYPDHMFTQTEKRETGTVLRDNDELLHRFETELFPGKTEDDQLMLKFMASAAFPGFYGLAMPLLKYGVPIRPVLLDNVRRYTGYLDDYDVLLLSYEFMKPDYPDINVGLAQWVRSGGTLLIIGDDKDPYHQMQNWWTNKYASPTDHLFQMLGLAQKEGIFPCGKGIVGYRSENPARYCFCKENADALRHFFREVLAVKGLRFEWKNYLYIERGAYQIAAVMDESVNGNDMVREGLFADMYTPDFAVTQKKVLHPGESTLLFDLTKIKDSELCIIGTSLRIFSLQQENKTIKLTCRGAAGFTANIRLHTPFPVQSACVDGKECECIYDAVSKTVLLRFESISGQREIIVQ